MERARPFVTSQSRSLCRRSPVEKFRRTINISVTKGLKIHGNSTASAWAAKLERRLGNTDLACRARPSIPMSAVSQISSAVPPGPDVAGASSERGVMTQLGHRTRWINDQKPSVYLRSYGPNILLFQRQARPVTNMVGRVPMDFGQQANVHHLEIRNLREHVVDSAKSRALY